MGDVERTWEDSERAHILAAPIPPLDREWLQQHVEDALEFLAHKDIPESIDKPGFRRNLTHLLRVGLTVLTRMEYCQPPEVFPSWEHYLKSASTLAAVREYHVQRLENSRQVAADRVGRLPVLTITAGD